MLEISGRCSSTSAKQHLYEIDGEGAMRIAQLLLQIDSGVVGFILRITLAVVMFPHGAQKVLGWFGGHGVRESLKSFTDSGIPAVLRTGACR